VVGFFSECGRVELAMAIRTALVAGPGPNPTMPRTAPAAGSMVADPVLHCDRLESGRLCFPVGAGIVADSVAQAEWEETLSKAAVLEAGGTGAG
jgi:anthranilate/para-aminobenzoate synthase component I